MYRRTVGNALLASMLSVGVCFPVFAAKKSDSALANEVIRQMESSGALDAALDRAIERKVRRDAEQRKKLADEAQKKRAELAKKARRIDPARDHIFGPVAAKISLIVYSDLECPYCKRFAGVPEAAAAKFGDQVNVIWRHYPLDIHGDNARKEAFAAECVARQAGSSGFFKFANSVLNETESNGKGLPKGDVGLEEVARQSGATNIPAFQQCLIEPLVAQRVDEDMKDGIGAGIEGTPGLIMRNNLTGRSEFAGGAIPQAGLEQLIQILLDDKVE